MNPILELFKTRKYYVGGPCTILETVKMKGSKRCRISSRLNAPGIFEDVHFKCYSRQGKQRHRALSPTYPTLLLFFYFLQTFKIAMAKFILPGLLLLFLLF